MDNVPSLISRLRSIRTTKDGEIYRTFKQEQDYEQPLSPMAQLFHEPGFNVYIIGMMGSKTKISPDVFKENLVHTFLKNRRFSSLQVRDKENGSMKWVPTHVDIDEHVIVEELDSNMESPDKFIEDYISNLSRSSIDYSKPLWHLHILNIKTSETEGTCVFRFHHSLGDGFSLTNLLLSCTRKVSDPHAFPTLPGFNKSEDTKTPMKGSKGVEHRPRRFVIRSVSLEDIKLVKNTLNVTMNDVVLGVTQAGLYCYLQGRYREINNKNTDMPANIRFRSTFFFNLRATTRIDDFTDMNTDGKWGNKIGYVLLPFNIRFRKDPLDYVRDAKDTMKLKKASLEPVLTYFFAKLVRKLFGVKFAGKLNHKVFYNTTLWFSNVPGPQEEISFFGHKVAYLAPSCYGQPNALMIHVMSYIDKVSFVISADEETIPDPHKLCDELEESFRIIKASTRNLHELK